ncbi:hypothetical protein J5Y04_26080 [Kitasatospora sp. RG8]|uniref:hypothetical protein n=1 Tax=Kitasatospora sp. RG8 TaxID=2820815 RepID=UPI001ADF53F6|nr:hypothetical protein [Kitasatospora sp. RG8]MBP0452988.1 hypothetical protein [Kitasatospora sp. RG8]
MSTVSRYQYTHEDRETKRLRLRADEFQFSATMERLADMKRNRPDQYDQMGAIAHLSLGHYEAAKAAAKQLGRNVSAPADREV